MTKASHYKQILVQVFQAKSHYTLEMRLVKYSFLIIIDLGVRGGPQRTYLGPLNPLYLCSHINQGGLIVRMIRQPKISLLTSKSLLKSTLTLTIDLVQINCVQFQTKTILSQTEGILFFLTKNFSLRIFTNMKKRPSKAQSQRAVRHHVLGKMET